MLNTTYLQTKSMSLIQDIQDLVNNQDKLDKKIKSIRQEKETLLTKLDQINEVLNTTLADKDKIDQEITEVHSYTFLSTILPIH